MDGLNTVDIPTISGLKHLNLDQIDTSILNADSVYLENLETSNIIIDNELKLLSGAYILANSLIISDTEISYLNGCESNIQGQLDAFGDLNDIVFTNQAKLQNQSATAGQTTFDGNITIDDLTLTTEANIYVNTKTISGVELSYLDGATSNIQSQINTDKSKLQNQSATAGQTTFDGNITIDDLTLTTEANIYVNTKTISGVELSYLDGATSNIQSQINTDKSNITVLTGRTQNLTATSGETTVIGNLKLQTGGNLLANSLTISAVELGYLDGVTSNIQTQLNSIVSSDLVALQNKTQNQSATAGVTTFSGDTRLTTLDVNGGITCYDNNVQYKAFTDTLYNKVTNVRVSWRDYSSSLWGTTWAFHTNYDSSYTYAFTGSNSVFSSGKVIKPGRYIMTFSANCANLKWFNVLKSRIIIKNQPSGDMRGDTMYAGRDLGGSEENFNEHNILYHTSITFDCTTTLDTSFEINHEYKFTSTNVSGETTLFWGEINVWEI